MDLRLYHDSHNRIFRSHFGARPTGSSLRLALEITGVPAEDLADCTVTLRLWHSQKGELLQPMELHDTLATVDLTMPSEPCLLWYYFIVKIGDSTVYYGNNPQYLGGSGAMSNTEPPAYQITVFTRNAKTPDWFKHSVMYQIFPDRFYRPADAPLPSKRGAVFHMSWDDEPYYFKDPDTKDIVAYDFFGGTLCGIEEKLDYLKDLGISVLYLNPIFESESNHRYDTGDYHKIDPILGTNDDFRHLIKAAEMKGLRIILDGVFSHTGSNSRYFNKNGQYDTVGAYQSKESPYYDWYSFHDYPDDYECWWNFETLPNVKETTPSYMDFIIGGPSTGTTTSAAKSAGETGDVTTATVHNAQGETGSASYTGNDSVLHHWLSEGIAGWRLDVIDELPQQFSRAFYKELKRTNPDAVVIGEVWEDASNKVAYDVSREYLSMPEIDGAMNYPLRSIIFDYLLHHDDANITTARIESLRENYPIQHFYAMMNLISSHDSQRALTVLGEYPYHDDMTASEQSKAHLSPDQYKLGKQRLLLATLFQMTLPGVPSIYYGDEIGMEGFKDPYNRRPYKWNTGDTNLREAVRQLIKLRNNHPALQTGEYIPLSCETDVLAYARAIRGGADVFGKAVDKDETFIIAFNRHETQSRTLSIDVSGIAEDTWINIIGVPQIGRVVNGQMKLTLPPLTGVVMAQYEEPKAKPVTSSTKASTIAKAASAPLSNAKASAPSAKAPLTARTAGVLLHPTSLPSKYGIGDFGKPAYDFVDFLAKGGQKIWQILPLGPVGYGYSPYQSISALAGNPMLIDLDELIAKNWLTTEEVDKAYVAYKINDKTPFAKAKVATEQVPLAVKKKTVDFDTVNTFKHALLQVAFKRFKADLSIKADYEAFCKKEAYWLDDYALFLALKEAYNNTSWTTWPDDIKQRDLSTLKALTDKYKDSIAFTKFEQFLFQCQWLRLKKYANDRQIKILGDMPIFVAPDSVDVWAHQALFNLKADGTPNMVAGVPPDYFSETGQLWGNPQYDWTAMKADNYRWWQQRFTKLYELVDIVRIDHFRGFESYWEVPSTETTAINGTWRQGPGKPFFDAIEKALGPMPIVAEDLGIITDAVNELRNDCGFPGMKVLHFAMINHPDGRVGFVAPENSVVYTGTHDNNTTVGWLNHDISLEERQNIANLLRADVKDPCEMTAKLIALAYSTRARTVIIPMQDLLGLDESGRMNTPGTVGKNWGWRLEPHALSDKLSKRLKELCLQYNRA